MRDDLKQNLSSINRLLENKLKLIQTITKNEEKKLSRIRSEKLDELDTLISDDQKIIDEIDSIDYEIRTIEENLARAAGMDRDIFFSYVTGLDSSEIKRTIEIKKAINVAVEEMLASRNITVGEMEKKNSATQKDIDQISGIKNIKFRI